MGVGGVKAVDVGQKDQQIRLGVGGHDGAQGVVVADDDLFGGDGIVLIDDGEGAQFQQAE